MGNIFISQLPSVDRRGFFVGVDGSIDALYNWNGELNIPLRLTTFKEHFYNGLKLELVR